LKSANLTTEKLPSPMLILVMGLPGSGKSYFARAFAKKINAVHFNSDIIRKQEPEHTAYTAADKLKVYQSMYSKTCQELTQGNTVVVDATFSLQKYRDPYLNYAKANQIPIKTILVSADENTIFQRLQHSRPDSDADFEVYKKIKSEFEPIALNYLELTSHLYTLDEQIELALVYIANNSG
jgi:predicted kinase